MTDPTEPIDLPDDVVAEDEELIAELHQLISDAIGDPD